MFTLVHASAGFAPGRMAAPVQQRTAAVSPLRMNVAGGASTARPEPAAATGQQLCGGVAVTETMDFTLGEIRAQRDVLDEQMRPRPSIDWSNLRVCTPAPPAPVASWRDGASDRLISCCAHRRRASRSSLASAMRS